MAFSVPQFPLTAEVFDGPFLTRVSRLTTPANLQIGRKALTFPVEELAWDRQWTGPVYLLVPAGTDLRDLSQGIPHTDIIEVPQGSGRWYTSTFVDDVAKGFPNEYRFAVLYKISENLNATEFAGMNWPIPMP